MFAAKCREIAEDSIMTIAVIIPCFRVRNHILAVIDGVRDAVDAIYVVDDCCPEGTGDFVTEHRPDPKVHVVRHAVNQGVGGATLSGYLAAAKDGHSILVKMDGDDQMDPAYLAALVKPIASGLADYTKGNRFFSLEYLSQMPKLRLLGNSGLSLVNKISSGYWDLMDPTNGYTALHAKLLPLLQVKKISPRYFFESDMLFRLGTINAVVMDIPIPARYGSEESNLDIGRVLLTFPKLYFVRFLKRIIYKYYLRDLNAGSIELLVGLLLVIFGTVFGVSGWIAAAEEQRAASSGTVMLAALPIIMGFQLLLSFLSFDVGNVPRSALHTRMP